MVSRSVMSSPSDLRRQLVQEVGVRARVDLALEELGGGAHRNGGHFPAQALLRPRGIELDLLLCGRDDARALAPRARWPPPGRARRRAPARPFRRPRVPARSCANAPPWRRE